MRRRPFAKSVGTTDNKQQQQQQHQQQQLKGTSCQLPPWTQACNSCSVSSSSTGRARGKEREFWPSSKCFHSMRIKDATPRKLTVADIVCTIHPGRKPSPLPLADNKNKNKNLKQTNNKQRNKHNKQNKQTNKEQTDKQIDSAKSSMHSNNHSLYNPMRTSVSETPRPNPRQSYELITNRTFAQTVVA
ncbi:unnamed protein product [Polarella glacialis]|uniref:Uncharacterized protein n=1 Tax=Polarella glacialis TaxID=89957 RepID=A0A813JL17_POLGL|nr:unnamed protein product [Polarella glacialis]